MKLYCYKNEFITPAVQYTIDFILNSLGYFYDWITDIETIPENSVLIVYAPVPRPFKFKGSVIHIPQNIILENIDKTDLTWQELEINNEAVPVIGKSSNIPTEDYKNYHLLQLDLPANIYFHLARIEELSFTHPDQVDAAVTKSILYKYDKFKLPVVDILSNWFSGIIDNIFKETNQLIIKKAAYPNGEEFGIALTHDVDMTRAYHPLKKFFIKFCISLGLYKNKTCQALDTEDQNTWGFDRLLNFYKQKNWRATFFFIPKYMEDAHFRYNIKNKKFKELFTQLKIDNHEIAFHPSRYSFDRPKRYLKEKKKLEKTANITIHGLRQHYLRCLFPQIWTIARKLNLKYDAGLIYRKFSGFRAGAAHPFNCFDHRNNAELNITEFPTAFFENTLPGEGKNIEQSLTVVNKIISQVKKYHGLLTALWHQNNLYQPESYPCFWDYFLKLIEKENVFLAALSEQLDWQNKRKQIQVDEITYLKTGLTFELSFPSNLNRFSLLFPSNNFEIELEDSKVNYCFNNNLLILKNNERISRITIKALRK
ncbi:MAG: hypothetical protein K8R79_03460 [Calditrichales bacterium]|nr:hypothetical protein [Calditrichales bacterium]